MTLVLAFKLYMLMYLGTYSLTARSIYTNLITGMEVKYKLDLGTWLCRTPLDDFWVNFGSYWTILDQYGPIWTNMDQFGPFCQFGPVYLDPSIWTHLFEPVYLDLYIWCRLFGPVSLDPSFLPHLFGPVYFNPSIWTRLFRPVYLDLSA